MKKCFVAIMVSMISILAFGQQDRYKFAQTYVGAQVDGIGRSNLPEYMACRFLIGGTHFWQKADF